MPFNGRRLKEARRFRKLSITDLANEIGVSKQMISRYERGESIPNAANYQKLVFKLKFPLSFFQLNDKFDKENLGTFYRSRFTSTQTEKRPSELKKKYLAILVNLFENYVDFPKLENNLSFSNNPALAAQEVRQSWGLGYEPIPNMMDLLERHGFNLAMISSDSDKVDAFGSEIEINSKKYYCILIDKDNDSYYRQQFSLAHELGHWALHSGKINPQELDSIDYRKMENQANDFASSFLLPPVKFQKDISGNETNLNYYLKLKRKWNVSIASMIYRTNDLGLLTPNEFRNLQKKLSYRRWRKIEPLDTESVPMKPVAMKQAYDLISGSELFDGNTINNLLEMEYGISLPLNIIAELLCVPEKKLKQNNSNIISLK